MKYKLIEKEEFEKLILQEQNIYKIAILTSISVNTLRSYLKKYNIKAPPGFYSKNKPRKKRRPLSEEYRKAMSERFNGIKNPFYGKKHSEKTKQKMSKNHADFNGDKNPFKKACIKNPSLIENSKKIKIKEWENLTKEERYTRSKKNIYKDISKNHWSNIQSNAKTRNLEFNITPEYAWSIWENQNGKCSYTGVELNLKSIDEITASLDRIDSYKGYIEGNIQWVHKDINKMKNFFHNKNFIEWCRKVVKWQDLQDLGIEHIQKVGVSI